MLLSRNYVQSVIVLLLLIPASCTKDTSHLIEESRFKLDEGKNNEALVYLNEAIEKNPTFEAYLLRGTAYFNLNDNQKAIISFTQASEIDPNDYRPFMNLGNVYVQIQQFSVAITNYNRAINLNSNIGKLYMNRGNVKFHQKKYKEAIADFNNAINIDTADYQPQFNKGRSLYMMLHFKDALTSFQKSLDLAENKAEPRYWVGVSYHQLGDRSRSCENLKIASELGDPSAKTAFLSFCEDKE